ncbi:hypothetical protein LCGC14_2186150 [marine sediment metagenome]|uniref:Uncharacterized protein n=1 Tax=marine sediment metagenome TaxID=412755 RepID=A0A0F9FYC2_9ZZZZ
MATWQSEANLPFSPSGHVFFSPVIDNLVYLIDQGTNFYSLNLETGVYTLLTSPAYGWTGSYLTHGEGGVIQMTGRFYRMITVSPDGNTLAVPSDGDFSTTHGTHAYNTGGARRIEFYDISANTWSASKQTDFSLSAVPSPYIRSLVWEDNDILWCLVVRRYRTSSGWGFVCAKYVKSTDTFTAFSQSVVQDTQTTHHGRYVGEGGMAIDDAKTTIYCGGTGHKNRMWREYDIAGDTWSTGALFSPLTGEKGVFAYKRDTLYTYQRGLSGSPDDCQIAKHVLASGSQVATPDIFAANAARDDYFSPYVGINDDEDLVVQWATDSAPEIYSIAEFPSAGGSQAHQLLGGAFI